MFFLTQHAYIDTIFNIRNVETFTKKCDQFVYVLKNKYFII